MKGRRLGPIIILFIYLFENDLLAKRKSNRPTNSSVSQIEKRLLRRSAKTVPLFKTGKVRIFVIELLKKIRQKFIIYQYLHMD